MLNGFYSKVFRFYLRASNRFKLSYDFHVIYRHVQGYFIFLKINIKSIL